MTSPRTMTSTAVKLDGIPQRRCSSPRTPVYRPQYGRPLTRMQLQTYAYLVKYETYAEACRAMGKTRQPFAKHLRNADERLGVSGRLAALKALGWLKIPEGLL